MVNLGRVHDKTLFKMWLGLFNKLPWSDKPGYKIVRKEMEIVEREMERREK